MAEKQTQNRYTTAERRAYYMGVGAWIGRGKLIATTAKEMTPKEKESFYNGLDDAFARRTRINKKGR